MPAPPQQLTIRTMREEDVPAIKEIFTAGTAISRFLPTSCALSPQAHARRIQPTCSESAAAECRILRCICVLLLLLLLLLPLPRVLLALVARLALLTPRACNRIPATHSARAKPLKLSVVVQDCEEVLTCH